MTIETVQLSGCGYLVVGYSPELKEIVRKSYVAETEKEKLSLASHAARQAGAVTWNIYRFEGRYNNSGEVA